MQTCWLSLNAFPEIAADIRKMYDRSILLTPNNNGQIDINIREDSLVYVIGNFIKKKSQFCTRPANSLIFLRFSKLLQ